MYDQFRSLCLPVMKMAESCYTKSRTVNEKSSCVQNLITGYKWMPIRYLYFISDTYMY
jgi:hypothetical protein